MPPARLEVLLAAARTLHRDPSSDADLLGRFLDQQDEAAFETLLLRHTPAVRAACRSWLSAAADIDDAAQATFLVLVQRAGSIRNRAALGRWLYRVAGHVAHRLRRQRPASCPVPEDVPALEPTDADLRDLLAEEVARLPEKYRLPVQLCYTAGLTTAEAAQRLGWPKGTVLTRLAWARKRLQKSLSRRGLAPAVLSGLVGLVARRVDARWVAVTAQAARALLTGESPVRTGVSESTLSLTEGVVRTMFWNKMKYLAAAVLLVVGLVGFTLGKWARATEEPANSTRPVVRGEDQRAPLPAAVRGQEPVNRPVPAEKEAKVGPARPAAPGRRKEVLIQLPSGTFVKDIDAAPYGSGRLTWTYEEDRVVGLIEASVMGFEAELATEAEISLSSNGTMYGVITSVQLNHLRVPDGEEYADLKPFAGLWSAAEPLVNEVLIDLPFSYRFRVQGDRLIISNFRILLAGPNPLGKVGGLFAGKTGDELFMALAAFQALGTALEGTYTAPGVQEKPAPNKRPLFQKLGTGKLGGKNR